MQASKEAMVGRQAATLVPLEEVTAVDRPWARREGSKARADPMVATRNEAATATLAATRNDRGTKRLVSVSVPFSYLDLRLLRRASKVFLDLCTVSGKKAWYV